MAKKRKDQSRGSVHKGTKSHRLKTPEQRGEYVQEMMADESYGSTGDAVNAEKTKSRLPEIDLTSDDLRDQIDPNTAQPKVAKPINWGQVWSFLGFILLLFITISGVIYKYSRLENKVRVNNDRISETNESVKSIEKLTQAVGERLKELEVRARQADANGEKITNLLIEIIKIKGNLKEIESRSEDERRAVLSAVDVRLSTLEAQISKDSEKEN